MRVSLHCLVGYQLLLMVGTGILLKNSFAFCPGNLQGQIIEKLTAADSGPEMNED